MVSPPSDLPEKTRSRRWGFNWNREDRAVLNNPEQGVIWSGLPTWGRWVKITDQRRPLMERPVNPGLLALVNRTRTRWALCYDPQWNQTASGEASCGAVRRLLMIMLLMLKEGMHCWLLGQRQYHPTLGPSRSSLAVLTFNETGCRSSEREP